MRYIKHYLTSIAGVEIYPLISLLIFFIFFCGLTVYVIKMKRNHSDYMAARPIDGTDSSDALPS
jgi:cytochrome c oxidase cbb3-type subunit IV